MKAETGLALPIGTEEEGRSWIGRTGPRVLCEDQINHAQIKNFCALVRDPSPQYWDEEWARKRYGGILSPPGMLFVWSMPLPWRPDGTPPAPLLTQVPLPGDTIINVTTESEFLLPVIVGDQLSVEEEVASISPEKRTALGAGHFLTTLARYRNQRDEIVATHRNIIFRYSATDAAAPRGNGERPQPAEEEAPLESGLETSFLVTLRMCVHLAGATRDLFPGHHDRDYARGQNARDVYLNTMCQHGVVDRVGGAWAGPDAWLLRRRLDMVSPICVGDTVRSRGRVTDRWEEEGDRFAQVDLRLDTEHGLGAKARLVYRWSKSS